MEPVIAGVVSALFAWLAPRTRLAQMLTDDPAGDELKIHVGRIPPIGGIGIGIGLVPALVSLGDPKIAIGAAGALALGIVDDARTIKPAVRLAVEVLIGVVVAMSPLVGGPWSQLLVAGGVVVMINAVNLFDGLDGLAGGATAVTAATVGLLTGSPLAWALAAALVGFLIFNWHPASVFLGDGGAYLVATMLVAVIGVTADDGLSIAALLGAGGVVLVDLVVTVLRRRASGRPLFEGDRSHSYDQLADRGIPVRRIAMLAMALQAVLCAAIALGWLVAPGVALMAAVLGNLLLVVVAGAGGFLSAQPQS